jgi:hypothetical protein
MRSGIVLLVCVIALTESVQAQESMLFRAKETATGLMHVSCDPGFLANGLECDTPCTQRRLLCRTFAGARNQGARWSDKADKATGQQVDIPSFVIALRESDSELSLRFVDVAIVPRTNTCEIRAGQCRQGFFVSGVICKDEACGKTNVICCKPEATVVPPPVNAEEDNEPAEQ